MNDRHSCEVCGAVVGELRRGRCWGCYARWVESRPVGFGARCVTCSDRRLRVLRTVELHGAWQVMCFNCAGQVMHMQPLPATLAELRAAVSRERRRADRRSGKPDTRVFAPPRSSRGRLAEGAVEENDERRVGERRLARTDYPPVDDEMIIEVTLAPDEDDDFGDLTQIRERLDILLAG